MNDVAAKTHGLSSFWDELVAAGDDLDGLLELIARRAAEVVGEGTVLATVSEDGETLEPAAVYHPDAAVREFMRRVLGAAPYRIGEGVAGAVAARREPAVLSQHDLEQIAAPATSHVQFVERYPMRGLVVVPLIAFGEVVGTLGAVRTASDRGYVDEDVMVMEALAERAALALAEATRQPRGIGHAEYEAIFRQSIDGVLFTAPDGRVLAANPAACEILQRSEAEICRLGRAGLLTDDPAAKAAIAMRAVKGSARAEVPMRRADGEIFTADVSSTIFTTPDGELRASVIFRDITERVRAQAALEAQNHHLALLHRVATAINEAPDATAAIHRTLEAIGVATGWPLGDAMLLSDDGVLRPAPAWRIADADRFGWFPGWVQASASGAGEDGLAGRVVTSGKPVWSDDLTRTPDLVRGTTPPPGPLRAYVGVPIMVGAEVRGVLELFADDTRPRDDGLLNVLVDLGTQLGRALERSEVDAAHRRLDDARADFIARAAHELRSPVAALVMAVGVLAGHEMADPRDRELLEVIVDSTDHLSRLVDRLLDLSTLEHGTPRLSIEPMDLQVAVDRALATCPVPPGRTVTCTIPEGSRVLADELSVEQILTNLLGNAYRYAAEHVQVDARQAGQHLELTVADDGPGVDPALESTLFEPFVRGEPTRTDGAGLGLAISHRLAVAMGGSLRYERADGAGGRFVVQLPAAV